MLELLNLDSKYSKTIGQKSTANVHWILSELQMITRLESHILWSHPQDTTSRPKVDWINLFCDLIS